MNKSSGTNSLDTRLIILRNAGILLFASAAYLLPFYLIAEPPSSMRMQVAVPIVAAAVLYGVPGGLIAAFLGSGLNALLASVKYAKEGEELLSIVVLSTLSLFILGFLVGYSRRLYRRLHMLEEKYRIIADSSYNVEIFLDAAGSIRYISPSLERMTGFQFNIESMRGKDLLKFVMKEDREAVYHTIIAAFRRSNVNYYEFRIKTRLGRIIWAEGISIPVSTPDGSFLGRRISIQDITPRKLIERELMQKNQLLNSILENIPQAIYWKDAKGIFQGANERFLTMLGIPDFDSVIGHSVEEVYSDVIHRSKAEQTDRHVLSNAAALTDYERYFTDVKGRARTYLCNKSPLFDHKGEVSGIVAIATDISRQKKVEADLRNTLNERDVLAQEIHHRVKNNLMLIQSLIDLEINSGMKSDKESALNDVKSRVHSIALIHEKLQAGGDHIEIDLRSYIEDIVSHILKPFSGAAITIDAELDIEDMRLPSKMVVHLGLMISELLTNALKYAFVGMEKGTITVAIKREKDNINLVFKDNGRGMSDEVLSEAHNCLGFKLIESFTMQLDGNMDICSEQGKGLLFRFSFPVHGSHKDPAEAGVSEPKLNTG
jgi:PAS domain S-box-containing protein